MNLKLCLIVFLAALLSGCTVHVHERRGVPMSVRRPVVVRHYSPPRQCNRPCRVWRYNRKIVWSPVRTHRRAAAPQARTHRRRSRRTR